MNTLIDLYIDDHKLSWAPSTLKSEKHRLYGVAEQLNGEAMHLWSHIQSQKPYGRVTTWTRVVDYWQWLIDNGHITERNVYAEFRRKNARLFKNTYQSSTPKITFAEAVKRIKSLPEGYDKNLATQIIGSGERHSEAIQQDKSIVVGKGSKRRSVFRTKAAYEYNARSYSTFRRALRSIGLKPHDLRKLFASRLVEAGVKEADLLKIMGWSSMVTAKAYLQPKNDTEIKALIEASVHKEMR